MASDNRDKSSIEDEFTQAAGTPGGAHRGRKSLGVRLRPYLIVLVIAICLALLLWAWLSGAIGGARTPSTAKSATTSVTQSAKKSTDSQATQTKETPGSKASPSTAKSSSPSSDQSSSSSAAVRKDTQIIVYNGGFTAGLAGKNRDILTQAGFTNVSANNPNDRSTLPEQATVWYRGEENKATAEEVAKTLGISNVEEATGIAAPVVAVVK